MPCLNDNNNGFFTGPYYPRPVFLAPESPSGSNNVQNPTRSEEWGFFLATPLTVASMENVPLTLSTSAGTAVSQQSDSVANITTGSYQISYNITASSATNPMSFGIKLNGVVLPHTIVTAVGNGDVISLSNSFILTVSSNSTLELANLTAGSVAETSASLAVTKLLN